jgi:hypothetical protein
LLYEAVTASRRWQGYALRAFLLLAMLVALWVAWFTLELEASRNVGTLNRYMVQLGERFYYGAAGLQLTLALLAAPAATAGAVCLDRARGWLAHMFVTQLVDAEIVLGKLAAKFATVLALVIAVVPVLALSALLGGIIPEALAVLVVTTLAVALLGCSLALAFSVRAAKMHEVLILVYALWAIWLLALPLWLGALHSGLVVRPPDWFAKLNPFVLVYSPYLKPGYVDLGDVAIFVAATLAISVAATVFAVRTLRKDLKPPGQRSAWVEARRLWIKSRLFSWWPSPSLEGNPVLWREWHRNRPSRMARLVSILFVGCTVLGTAIGIIDAIQHGTGSGGGLLVPTSFIAVMFGLLLLSATAPTTLTEERVRGSLDVLLSTPLATHAVVLGKWWATYRRMLPMVVLPALAGLFLAGSCLDYPSWMSARMFPRAKPITTTDRLVGGVLPSAFFLAHSAALTSFGLALATWFKRTGLAAAMSVAAFVVMSIGWIVAVETAGKRMLQWWLSSGSWLDNDRINALSESLIALSPMGGQIAPFDTLMAGWYHERDLTWKFMLVALGIVAVVAVFFLGLTLLTFNRCMGRMNESPDLRRYLSILTTVPLHTIAPLPIRKGPP